ncbi:Stk1 family PASTA domain-containing Ser/Thr kinase [Xylanimonas protaetiae]|uniref:non-specific serine/threonine protein kinase n=1 Tax=Xylanimonas protaetiae TaxID=2509457 RepID=A0A4P6F1A6_9MICO|nr:Stk1 family PASTA domain-containing Ser/Thr kinase [Xylanimonas protaetiae]QAY69550.1 Stk1 family PASTA domain-containing Ser/Thr kinase [Xylanimonas protaetiae]
MVDNTPRVLAGRYEVGELIGRGGMAEVHIGHDARLGRTVAIKVLRSDLARDPSFLARFRREAQAAAALNHPAIVAVYDTGEDVHTDPATGNQVHIPFIVMEYVEGHTVRDILQDGAAVPIEEAVEITAGVLSALEYSHHAGIIHRDIKPANVMITPTGAVKVMDFGIARAVADSAATMTATHAVIGTAQYLSPEQARGEQVDARSDLYSTGCLLFELLTGRPPFVGDSPVAVAYQHVGQAPQRPSEIASDVPEVLDRITLKALAKERGTRYSSAAEFRADLETAMRGGAVSAPTVSAGLAAAGAALGGAPTVAFGAPGYGDAGTQLLTPDVAPTQQWGAPAATQAMPPAGVGGGPAGPVVPSGPSRQELAEKRRRKTLVGWLVGLGVLAVAVIVGIVLWNGRGPATPELVEVPTVQAGMTRAQAEELVTSKGFLFSDAIDPDSNEPEGTFTRQDPAGGTTARKSSTVTVYFSGGPSSLGVPDIAGKTQDEARQTIEAAGLVWGDVTPEPSIDVAQDKVTRTDPPANQFIQSGATVNVFVSDGTVELRDLAGMTQDEANTELTRVRLTGTFQEVESATVEPGRVVDQTPAAGFVKQGTRVTVRIAKAPAIEQVPVPNLVGKPWNDAMELCAPLNCSPSFEHSTTVPNASVIRTSPPAGTMLDEGSTISVVISLGPEAPTNGNNNGTNPPSTPPPADPNG